MRAGITQKQVAIHLGVSQPSVSDWFNNKSNPSGERLDKLADLLGVSRSIILGYDPLPGDALQKGNAQGEEVEILFLTREGKPISKEKRKKATELLRIMMEEMDDDRLDQATQVIEILRDKK